MSAPQRLVTRAPWQHAQPPRTPRFAHTKAAALSAPRSHRLVHHRGAEAAEPGSYRSRQGKNRGTLRRRLYRPALRQTPLSRNRADQPAAPRPPPAPEEAGSVRGGGWRRWVRGGGAAVREGVWGGAGARLVPADPGVKGSGPARCEGREPSPSFQAAFGLSRWKVTVSHVASRWWTLLLIRLEERRLRRGVTARPVGALEIHWRP